MRERLIERYLKRKVEGAAGLACKFVSPGRSGVPDRVVMFPGGKIIFVELKAPNEPLRPIQQKRKEELERLGFTVLVIDRFGGVDEMMRCI